MTALLLLVLAVLPHLGLTGERFLVTFSPGAVYACTIYTSTTETIMQDGKTVPYAPRHCWFVDEDATEYDDDWAFIEPAGSAWLVQATMYYPVDGGRSVRESVSNVVRVVR